MWANRIALQWDMYLDHQECLAEILQLNLGCIKFKTMDIEVLLFLQRAIITFDP